MPGNEVGDRIHNFFGQENLSQGQHHSQVVDGSWPGLSNNLWVGSQRQIADSQRDHGVQSSSLLQAVNFSQSNLRPEFARSQSHSQQPTLNGYMHGHQVFQTRQNETNFLGVDTESDRRNLASRGFSNIDSQLGNGPELKRNSGRMDFSESPVNFDFFGGQQHMNSQHSGMPQSLSRQQSGVNDMQLIQQQVMLKQVQEMQRQQLLQKQQMQQHEARQLSSINQVSPSSKQGTGSHSAALINGIPVHDVANYSWQPELLTANTNWPQRGASPIVQGSSSSLMFSPEQGQAPRTMGMVPLPVDQSIHGVPVSGTRVTPSQYSSVQLDKHTVQQISGIGNSFMSNQFIGLPDQIGMQDGNLASRQGYQGKNMIGTADGQGMTSGFNFENLQQVNVQEFQDRRELSHPSETLPEKTMIQVSPSQNVATLDPTEEKILYGSDDNLWDAFGRGNLGSGGCLLDSTDTFGLFPSIQSGSWSALMQSAVAETSSGDAGSSGLTLRNNEPASGNQQTLTVDESSKQPLAWAGNSFQAASTLNFRPFSMSDDTSNELSGRLHVGSQRIFNQFPGEGAKGFDRSLQQNTIAEDKQIYGKVAHSFDAEPNAKSVAGSWINQLTIPSYNSGDQQDNKFNGWNFIESVSPSPVSGLRNQGNEKSLQASHSTFNDIASLPESSAAKTKHESSQQYPNRNNIDVWKHVDSSVNHKGNKIAGEYQPHIDKCQQTFESLGNNSSANGVVETHEAQNSKMKENITESFHNTSHHTSTVGVRESSWLSNSNTLSGGRQRSSSNISRKPSGIRKFQYHPMGDLDDDEEPSYEAKHVTHSQSMPQQPSQGLKNHNQVHTGEFKFHNHIARNSVETEKGHLSGFQGETKRADEIHSKSAPPGSSPSTSASDRTMTSSQNMLELLHKVDQYGDHGNSTHFISSDHNQSFEMQETKTSDGAVHLQHNRPSASRGFGLQLAPPSQRPSISDQAFSSQGVSRTINSLSSNHVSSDMGDKGWLASTSSVQSLPPSHSTLQGELSDSLSASSGKTGTNAQGNFSASFSAGFPYAGRNLHHQQMSDVDEQAATSQSVNASLDRFASQSKQKQINEDRAQNSQPAIASMPGMSQGTSHNNIAPSAEMSQPSSYNQSHSRDSTQQFPILDASSAHQLQTTSSMPQDGNSSKMSPAVWNSVSSHQRSFGAQPVKAPTNMFKSNLRSNNVPNFSQLRKGEDQNVQTWGTGPSESGACSVNSQGSPGKEKHAKGDTWAHVSPETDFVRKTTSVTQGKESVANNFAGTSFSSPISTQREIEAFGRSLRPNNTLHHSNSLLTQVQGMKSAEVDPGNQSLKRFKGPDDAVDAQPIASQEVQRLYGHNNMTSDASTNQTSILSGDSKMLSFSVKSTDADTSAPSKDMMAFGRNDSLHIATSNSSASARGEHAQISPQMAPSWFNQYGILRNGQMTPMRDVQKATTIKSTELPLTVGRPFDQWDAHGLMEQGNIVAADAVRCGLVKKSPTISLQASENFSSPLSLLPDAAQTSSDAIKPKKRKSATSELVQWHKEVMQGPERFQNISMAELQWAKATNRLTEKVEDDAEMMEDVPPVVRSKRRLVLTTQLIQTLFRPPLASVLSADAVSHYESVTHFVARSTLGDACGSLSCSGGDTLASFNTETNLPEKPKTSERISDQYFSKVMEDLVGRATKLENELLRLDKRASVLDLRLECHELEKYSVINRFAKFHGRAQADGAETLSSSDASASILKFFPQRYVTALPMPRNLPDRTCGVVGTFDGSVERLMQECIVALRLFSATTSDKDIINVFSLHALLHTHSK